MASYSTDNDATIGELREILKEHELEYNSLNEKVIKTEETLKVIRSNMRRLEIILGLLQSKINERLKKSDGLLPPNNSMVDEPSRPGSGNSGISLGSDGNLGDVESFHDEK